MPGTTLPNTGVVLPTVGGDAGVWGTEVNTALGNYDAHSHVPGAGVAVPVAGLNINADISFSSLYAVSQLARAQFSAVAAAASNLSFFVSNGSGGLTANELYWRNNAGNFIRVTSGNALNFAAFVGGIGGDYTAVGAAEAFDDSQKQYTFKDGTAKWARLHAGNVRLAPFGTASAFSVELAAPALASSYTVTWPSALPASGVHPMSIDSAGTITTNATITLNIPAKSGNAGGGAVTDGLVACSPTAMYIAVPLLVGLTAVSATVNYVVAAGGSITVSTVKTTNTSPVTTAIFIDAVVGIKTSSPFTLAATVAANTFHEVKITGNSSAQVAGITVTYAQ